MPLAIVPEPEPEERRALELVLEPPPSRAEPGAWWRAGVAESLRQTADEPEL